MADLNQEFDSIVDEIQHKVRLASELLVEVSKLSRDNNILLDKSEIENLKNIIADLSPFDWESSDTSSVWQSSTSYAC